MINSNKRNTLGKIAFFSAAGFLTACNNNLKEKSEKIKTKNFPEIKLKMVTSFPRNLPGADIPAQRLVRKIKQMSLGKINIVHYAAGELVPAFEVFDAVREKKS